jgi:GT2 family glycosyltransferase
VESVSFIVIAHNEEATIAATISSIAELDGLAEYEIIVVNDGSRDKTTEIVDGIAARNPNVKHIARPDKMGRGNARKTGVEAASGDLIATVDADIILPRDWLLRAREALTNCDAVGGTGIPDGDVAYIHRRFGLVPRLVGQATTVTGGNALYRRTVFDVVQFDSGLENGEDVALNYEMDASGLACETVPGLVVEHREHKSFRTSVQWLFESGVGATRQFRTYREVRQPDIVTACFAGALGVGISVAALTRKPAALAVPACFVAAASVQHVRTRFKIGLGDLPRAVPATAVDAVLLTAYFAGRLAGVGQRLPEQRPVQAAARAANRRR